MLLFISVFKLQCAMEIIYKYSILTLPVFLLFKVYITSDVYFWFGISYCCNFFGFLFIKNFLKEW